MYPENPEGTQVIVGSMNMGYISDTARNWTHNLFRPKREPIPLCHSDGQFWVAGCSTSHQPARIREETLESGNLFSSIWISISVPYYFKHWITTYVRTYVSRPPRVGWWPVSSRSAPAELCSHPDRCTGSGPGKAVLQSILPWRRPWQML